MIPLRILYWNYVMTVLFLMVFFSSIHTFSFEINRSTFQIEKDSSKTIKVSNNIQVKDYFKFIDSLVSYYNSIQSYPISEHILVRHNPWIIDSLANTDYYRMIEKDSFVYDQKEMIILKKNCELKIPDSLESDALLIAFDKTIIDINIPEYSLRIFEDSLLLYVFPVRVGKNKKKYLKMGDRVTDLKTKTGTGTIVAHNRNPDYYNPVDGHQYFLTKRDDKKTTKLPQIPFIETEINAIRNGQLIHPTTNPETLEKAYSNGCIGTKEADAWVIYYYAPVNTKIQIRYDLNITDSIGESIKLKDIYDYDKLK